MVTMCVGNASLVEFLQVEFVLELFRFEKCFVLRIVCDLYMGQPDLDLDKS